MRDIENVSVIRAQSLNVNGRSTFSREFPLGQGWYKMMLRVKLSLTIGTGSGAISEGELKILSNILLRTDAGETLVNLPARALQAICQKRYSYTPETDAIAAADGDYYVNIPIFFTDDTLQRPEDSILDTSRYNSVSLEITCGGVSDLLTTVGTSSLTAEIDVDIQRTKDLLPDLALPLFVISQEFVPPVDASSSTKIDIDRSTDLSLKTVYAHSCSSGTSGVPLSGTNDDTVQDIVSLQDQSGFIIQQRIHDMIQVQNRIEHGFTAIKVGYEIHDFVMDGSINSALWTGDKSKLQYTWTNQAGVAANDLVTVFYDGIRTLK